MTFYGIEEWAANAIVVAAAIVFRNCSKGLEITPEAEMTKEKEVNSREQNRTATKEQRGLEDNVAMSEATGPRFRLICDDARDCMARYCFENAKYWAIWSEAPPAQNP